MSLDQATETVGTPASLTGGDAWLAGDRGNAGPDVAASGFGASSAPDVSVGVPELTGGWLAGAWALVALAMALAAGGFANSFTAVHDAVEPSFGRLAWTVPVLIDVGVAVFTGIDLLFTRLEMRLWWLRLVPWSLVAATIWLNVADETTSVGVVAHAAPPVLWVVTVELACHAMRSRAGLDTERATRRRPAGRMDKVRTSRWLLAPWSTLVIRRWMILQEERSYERANARWWARKQAKWELQDTYGAILWRVRAPRQARGLYRWGHLTPGGLMAPEVEGIEALTDHLSASSDVGVDGLKGREVDGEEGPEVDGADSQEVESWKVDRVGKKADGVENAEVDSVDGLDTRKVDSREASVGRRGALRRPARGRKRAGFADFEATAAELRAEGLPVNRTLVTRRLRDRGLSLANDRADEYLHRLEGVDAAA